MQFSELQLDPRILKALVAAKYEHPTPIQEQSIPVILEKRDLLGTAQTGTGKTAAFAVPILDLLCREHPQPAATRPIRALVLSPTRELAIQIKESFDLYGRFLRLRNTVIFGGVSQVPQVSRLREGVDILIATPGRLLDLMNQRHIDLSHVSYFVLDEADRMLDMGFIHDVHKVVEKLPQNRQTLLFSATMPPDIAKLADKLLKDPAQVSVAPVSSTAETVEQKLFFVDKKNKKHLLVHLLKTNDMESVLVFSRTKHGANKIVEHLEKAGIPSKAIHGNKSQSARQQALREFKTRKIHVLVATDIAARGIDVTELSHVINFDLPNEPETYVHRIGRTGRAGQSGMALSFCDEEEHSYLKSIEKLIGKKVPVDDEHPYPATLAPTAPPKQGGRGGQRPAPRHSLQTHSSSHHSTPRAAGPRSNRTHKGRIGTAKPRTGA